VKNSFKPKRKYGQNFLNSEIIANKISDISNITDSNVIEIGPGNLILTNQLLKKKPKKFIAIEIDKELIIKNHNQNFDIKKYVLNEDALKFNELNYFNHKPITIISNLPFNISSELLIKWLKLHNETFLINEMVLMFQKELGERIVSNVNSSKYGRLSILTQLIFNVTSEMIVKKEHFEPKPKVDAIVLKMSQLKNQKKINFSNIEKITNIFFNTRRKKNEKKIKELFTDKQIKDNGLEKYFKLRPQNIPKEIYYKMSLFI